jgi:hypothetical protein
MIVEIPDLIGEWLQNATHGVNALIPGVPRKAGDAAPDAITSFLISTRSGLAARAKLPNDPALYPLLVIGQDGPAGIDVSIRQGVWDSENFPLSVGYCVREVLSEVGVRDAGYTMRAVMRSIWRLFDPDNAAGAAARNNIHGNSSIAVQSLTKMDIVDTVAELEDALILGAVRIELRVRDNQPGG